MRTPSYLEMARAVDRLALQAKQVAQDIKEGRAIGPTARDIRMGAVDPIWEAECLMRAAAELSATARLLQTNNATEERRRATA